MSKRGTSTRQRIIDESRKLIYANGYGGTTIDQILEKTGITKGSFFHHFKSKADLSKAILADYIERDHSTIYEMIELARKKTDDPLDRLVEFIDLSIQLLVDSTAAPDACLYASYSYSPDQFDETVKSRIEQAIESNCNKVGEMFQDIYKKYNLKKDVDPKGLEYTYEIIFQGGFILSRITGKHEVIKHQLEHFKNYLRGIFEPK